MRLLDRYILTNFLVNCVLALSVLAGMYILFDLIVNVQDFAKGAAFATPQAKVSVWSIIADMFDYYLYQFPVIFQQIAGVVPLLAAGFTMVRMTRHHELTAMLASGVSLYRVAAPIVLVSMGIATLNVLNQEFLISQPQVIKMLLRRHDEVNVAQSKNEPLVLVKDRDGSVLSAREYIPDEKTNSGVLIGLTIVERDEYGKAIRHTIASRATLTEDPALKAGVLVMEDVVTEDDTGRHPDARPEKTQTRTTSLTPDQINLMLQKKAVDFLSSAQVSRLAAFAPDSNKPLLYKIMHLRFTQPLMNIVLLLIGIPFLLTREPNRLVINMFYCTAVTGVIFVVTFVIFQMAGTQLDPLWGAWLPVLIFGPFSLVMLDFIKT